MSRNAAIIILAVLIAAGAGFYFLGQSSSDGRPAFAPEGHFKTMNAADAEGSKAEQLYQSIISDMRSGYAESDEPAGRAYQTWTRFNTAPYKSKTHGERYVNNYGNALAAEYRAVKQGKVMPVGAILAKDAFAITTEGDVYAQSLFVMEKLPAGSSKPTGDWRYVMITPTGETYGDTRGEEPGKVDFCHDCHKSVRNSDYLFYVPEAYRALR
ncbi:cytochrome P460 family protein [Minwuia sp.]|uniref:cytochrome P460 family protein n=1 Tax=Minwuia sp. TaxID=2493630 RepID=UPI003A9487C5